MKHNICFDNGYTSQRAFIAILPMIILLTAVVQLMPFDLALALVVENGFIENLSVAGYLAGAALLFRQARRGRLAVGYSACFILLLMALRELDAHTMFTTMGVFKTRYYISPQVPPVEKILVSIVVLVIAFIVIGFVVSNWRRFLQDLRLRKLYALAVAAAVLFAVLSKLVDSCSDPLEPFIAIFSSDPKMFMRITEEVMELAIPLYLLLAVGQSFCGANTRLDMKEPDGLRPERV